MQEISCLPMLDRAVGALPVVWVELAGEELDEIVAGDLLVGLTDFERTLLPPSRAKQNKL